MSGQNHESGPDQEPGPRGEINAAWDEVGARFADLGRLIKERQQRRTSGEDKPAEEPTTTQATGEAKAGSDPTGPVRQAVDALDDAFSALGDVVRDSDFKREAKGTLDAFGSALGVTFSELGDHLRERFDKPKR